MFCHPDGRPYHPDRFSREFDRRVARHGVPRIRLHDLRHTWTTLALQAGVDVKIVSQRLGHASATITWDVDQHETPVMHSDVAERVANLISSRGRRADVPRLNFFYGSHDAPRPEVALVPLSTGAA